jgi:phosphatidate phosphatase APP1
MFTSPAAAGQPPGSAVVFAKKSISNPQLNCTAMPINKLPDRLEKLLKRASHIFDAPDPLVAVPYRGYASSERFFIKGRVLENEGIFEGKSESELRNLLDAFRRFESDEIAGAKVGIRLANNYYETLTDKEGYFTINAPWQSPPEPKENRWLPAQVQLLESPIGELPPTAFDAEVLFPSKNASCGIISDVDDTVLQTHVTSTFKLKMIYATLFKDSHQRLPMEGINDLLRALEKGDNGQRENPIFYVSDSPWNIYDLLAEFMELQQLPKGPILLRDYGPHLLRRPKDYVGHKVETFRHILNMYPDLPFIMLGDTASKDADHYLAMAQEFSGRVAAIYIRHTRDNANARRVAKLVEANSSIDVVLVKSSAEIYAHAKQKGLLA